MSRRRSRGLEVTIASTRPCETTECDSLPRPVSDSTSRTSTRRQRAPLSRYSPSPLRSRRRRIEISPSGRSIAPSELSSTSSTSADERACTPLPPPKMTSCGDCPPIAHSTASVTFDLPEPLGPTTTDTPDAKSSFVRSGNDLKPLRVSDFRCMGSSVVLEFVLVGGIQHVQRGARRLLLCVLLRAPRAGADRPLADRGEDLEGAVVRRAVLGGDLVADDLAALGQALLQRRLEVHRMVERVLDLGHERLDDRRRRPLVAGVQVAGADDRLDDAGQHALGAHERRRALADA